MLLLLAACAHPVDEGDKPGGGGGDTSSVAVPALIPLPALVEAGDGAYALDDDTRIVATGDAAAVGERLAEALRPATGLPLLLSDTGAGITLVLDPSLDVPAEGYTLDADEDGVTVAAADADGLFWGTQTLRQLLPPASLAPDLQDGDWRVPAVHVEDAPRFAWRGLMLDVARHFFTVDEVERQVDLLALHKMNRLHLHLTDDQGWRIEIRSWPDLATIGGSTEVGGGEGGYYTQEDYAAIVAYAADRHVTVVPEIDFPGHANAALASYAELNADGQRADLYTGTGVISTPLWLDGPATRGFVEDVWREVAALTPGGVVHVGGDEAIDYSAAEYGDFVAWLQDAVTADGKTMAGWDEVGTAELAAPFFAQHWYDEGNARLAVAQGGRLVESPASHTYLDMVYDGDAEFGQTWAGAVDVERAYDWDPIPTGLDEGDVAGVEGTLFTEYVDTVDKMDFMLWPRLCAHAEVGWTAESARGWDDFRGRLVEHGERLDALDVGYYRTPEVDWE